MLYIAETGRLLEPAVDLKTVTQKADGRYVYIKGSHHFGHAIEDLASDTCVFFEFKHYKSKKVKFSTRGWSFFYVDEARDGTRRFVLLLVILGAFELPLYQKPTDLSRKKIRPMDPFNGEQCVIQLSLSVTDQSPLSEKVKR